MTITPGAFYDAASVAFVLQENGGNESITFLAGNIHLLFESVDLDLPSTVNIYYAVKSSSGATIWSNLQTAAVNHFITFIATVPNIAVHPGTYHMEVVMSCNGANDCTVVGDDVIVTDESGATDWFDEELIFRLIKNAELTWAEGDQNTRILENRIAYLKQRLIDIPAEIRQGFKLLAKSNYTTTPVNTTTITTLTPQNTKFFAGDVVKIMVGGVAQYNMIISCNTTTLVVTGVPISGEIEDLYYWIGSNKYVEIFNIAIQDAAIVEWNTYQVGGILTDVLNNARRKKVLKFAKGYLCGFQTYCYTEDTSATKLQVDLHNGGNVVAAATFTTTPTFKPIVPSFAHIAGLTPVTLNIPNAGGYKNTFQAEVNIYNFNFDMDEN